MAAGIVIGIIFGIALCIASGQIADKKGYNPTFYYILGFFLPIIGLIVAVAMPENRETTVNRNPKSPIYANNVLDKGVTVDSWYLDLPFEIIEERIIVSNDKTEAALSLKLYNTGDKPIKSIYLRIECLDDTGEKACAENEFTYAYQDLSVKPGAFFGQYTFIKLLDSKTRIVNIEFEKMSFIDGTVIKRNDISSKCELFGEHACVIDSQDIKYYQDKLNSSGLHPVKYKPIFQDDGKWMCVCGRTNFGIDCCARCKRKMSDIKEALKPENYREWHQKKEKNEKEEQEKNRKIILMATIIGIVLIGTLWLITSIYGAFKYSGIAGEYGLYSVVDDYDSEEELLWHILERDDGVVDFESIEDYSLEIHRNGEATFSYCCENILYTENGKISKNEDDYDLLDEGYQYKIIWTDNNDYEYSDEGTIELYLKISDETAKIYCICDYDSYTTWRYYGSDYYLEFKKDYVVEAANNDGVSVGDMVTWTNPVSEKEIDYLTVCSNCKARWADKVFTNSEMEECFLCEKCLNAFDDTIKSILYP